MTAIAPRLILVALCLALPLSAAALQPQTQGEVRFLSGGVGAEESSALKAVRDQYNLHLLFSAKDTGEYLSDIEVRIADAAGKTLVETVSEGPQLFAQLKPGRYIIDAVYGGKSLRKTVSITEKRGASLSLIWPESLED
jgi:hypothetical protein